MAKVTAKNINQNYVTQRAAVLPEMVKLDTASGISIQEQLHDILKEHQVRLIDLFREWDDDGNGALDKKELRQAIAALGSGGPKSAVDALFNSIDDDGNGWIEFAELKMALNEKNAKRATKELADKKKKADAIKASDVAAADGDVGGEGEEDFETGMRQNAMERDAADADNDGKLDFGEFCVFVREREEGEFTEAELRTRFDALDEDRSGKVDMHEYLHWSLRDALMRSSSRVVDLFRAWDEDGNGTIDKKEFGKAVRSLGFDVDRSDTDAVFDSLDDDNSGLLEYKELNEMLRKGVGAVGTKANLKRMAGKQKDTSRMAKVTAKNINQNYVTQRAAVLPEMVKLDTASGISIQEQLHGILKEHQVRLIDLFREWDDDGNGALDKKELRQAIAALGYDAPRKEIDKFFETIDDDGNGWIEFAELKMALNEKNAKEATRELARNKMKADAAGSGG